MAFVFRSEKKNSIPLQPEPKDPVRVDEGEDKMDRQGAICKGLPHLNQKYQSGSQKENCLPDIEAHPIHSPSTLSFNATVFKSREFNDAKINEYARIDDPNMKPVLTVKEISQKKGPFTPLTSNYPQDKVVDSKSAKTIGKTMEEEKPNIINKNLLKTMMHMSQKFKETLQIDKIAINESKEGSSLKKNKLQGWKSLKRLSPLKDHRDFAKLGQTLQTNDINISCGQKSSKPEEAKPALKAEKTIMKPKVATDVNDESSEEEYADDATPGPGTYSYQQLSKKKQFRSKRTKFQKIFYSQIDRFQGQQKKYQEVTYINDEQSQKDASNKSFCQSFLSKSPKFKESQEGEYPPPGYYETRQTLQHDLVRHILKSSNTTTFINRSPRPFKVKGEDMPGPGAYTLDRSFQRLQEEKDKLSFSYKSQLQRKLEHSPKQAEIIQQASIYDCGNENSVIHVKQDAVLEKYYITEVPGFMSSTERFPRLKMQCSNEQKYQNYTENITVPSPPKQAFNSSEKREAFGKVGEGVGIGLYNLNKDIWSKKSYNILFN